MPLSVTRVVNALLCTDELYCPLHQSGVAVAGATNAVNTKQSEAVTVSLFFRSITPTHRHFVLSPVSLTSRDQDGCPSDSTINIYDLMEKWGTVNSLICLLKRKFVNIEFVPSKFYFVYCKAFSVLNKIKWYCQIEGFLLRF